jgi:hypothetical protein
VISSSHLGYERLRAIRDLIQRLVKDRKLKDSEICRTVRQNVGTGRPATEFWLTEAQALKVVARSVTVHYCRAAATVQASRMINDPTDMARQADAFACMYGAIFEPLLDDPRAGVHKTDSPMSWREAHALKADLELHGLIRATFEFARGGHVLLVPRGE